MFWTTIGILFLLLAVSYFFTRSIIHPGVVTSGIWLILLLIYNAADFELYKLSDEFYQAVLSWTCPFCLASLINQRTSSFVLHSIAGDANAVTLSRIKPLLIFALILASLALIYRGMLFNSSNIFNGIRQASVATLSGDEDAIPFPIWLKPFVELANTAALPVCMYMLVIKKDWSRYSKILLGLLIFFFLLRSNKNVIAQIGLAFVCLMLLEQTIAKKKILNILIVMMIVMIGVSYIRRLGIRGDGFIITEFIAQYLLAPLPAFDSVLHSSSLIEDFHGEYTFRAFIKIIQIFNPLVVGNSDPFNLGNWVFTPIPVNVYTVLFPFYEDFGYTGLVCFAIILGGIAGILYKHAIKGYLISKLIYSCMFYTLVFQFFADNFFQFFWTNMTYVFFCIMLVYRGGFRNEEKLHV
ncbi:MAG: oligosaccharide repeat unit polymerase [Paludibacteraceae bacterium]|nr:oligosaccharide repeat unit polymerase [Paludibacteraceae bacterium]